MKTIAAAIVAASLAFAAIAPSTARADETCTCKKGYDKYGNCKGGKEKCKDLPESSK